MSKEIWKQIKDIPTHEISNKGKVRACAIESNFGKNKKKFTERFINPWKSKTGYNYVDISVLGKRNRFLLHRLVAIYFIPNPLNSPQVNHKDGNKDNCNDWNLEWSTPAENLKHARDLGLNKSVGFDNKMSKLSKENVMEIRNSNLNGESLSKKYNVSASVISRVKSFKSYKL